MMPINGNFSLHLNQLKGDHILSMKNSVANCRKTKFQTEKNTWESKFLFEQEMTRLHEMSLILYNCISLQDR